MVSAIVAVAPLSDQMFARKAVTSMQTVNRSIPQDGETGFVETSGPLVRYCVRGDGPPLLMLQGAGAPLEYWSRLETNRQVFLQEI
jgi:hypothetical protein